jgi:hypothetical protein
MSAPPGTAMVAVLPAGDRISPIDMAERPPGIRKGATGLAKRHEAHHADVSEQRSLAMAQRVPPRRSSLTCAGAYAVVTRTGALVISVRIAARAAPVVRHPYQAHPRSPERAAACTAAASDPPEVMLAAQPPAVYYPSALSSQVSGRYTNIFTINWLNRPREVYAL